MKMKTQKQMKRNIRIEDIFSILFGCVLIVVGIFIMVYFIDSLNEQNQLREIKQLFCNEEGGDYLEFNKTDYCYGDIPNGLVLIGMEEVCYPEGLCTFRLRQ